MIFSSIITSSLTDIIASSEVISVSVSGSGSKISSFAFISFITVTPVEPKPPSPVLVAPKFVFFC